VKMSLAYDRLVNNVIESNAVTGFQSIFRAREARKRKNKLLIERKKKLLILKENKSINSENTPTNFIIPMFCLSMYKFNCNNLNNYTAFLVIFANSNYSYENAIQVFGYYPVKRGLFLRSRKHKH